MRKIFIVALVLAGAFLCAPSARAQFTTVTATVTDPNGIPYAAGTMTANLTPSSPGSWTLSGNPYSGRIGPITLDSAGSFTANFGSNAIILPAGSQWQITVNSNQGGIAPPLGTGAQTFTVTMTISGATQNISATLNAAAPKLTNFVSAGGVTSLSGTSPIVVVPNPIIGIGTISCPTCNISSPSVPFSNTYYASTNCTGVPNCTQVKWDVQYATGATWSNGGSTITTAASDPAFVAGDVGKILFASTNCLTIANAGIGCQLAIPQGTITTVSSAHVAVTSATATMANAAPNGNFTGWVLWGSDDTTAVQNFWLGVIASRGGYGVLPCGMGFVQAPPFIRPSSGTDGFFAQELSGCADNAGGTYVIPTPNFNYAACVNACLYYNPNALFSPPGITAQVLKANYWTTLQNITFWGGGNDGTLVSLTKPLIDIIQGYATNVSVIDWLNNVGNGTKNTTCAFQLDSAILENAVAESAGNCGFDSKTNLPFGFANSISDSYSYETADTLTVGHALIVEQPIAGGAGILNTRNNFFQDGAGAAPTSQWAVSQTSGIWNSEDDVQMFQVSLTGGTANWSHSGTTVQLGIAGGTLNVRDGSLGQLVMSSGILRDLCGNISPSVTGPAAGIQPVITGGTFVNCPSEPSVGKRCLLASAAGPLACGFSGNGRVAVPATTTSYTINTIAPQSGSVITITPTTDNSGIPGSPTCGAEVPGDGSRSATSVGTSFTFTQTSAAVIKCYDWAIR